MSSETISAVASIGTFIVIGATAVAAIVQLRHMRSSNQLNVLLNLLAVFEDPRMQRRFSFVRNEFPDRMKDPTFRSGLERLPVDRTTHPEMYVLDYYHHLGVFLALGLIEDQTLLVIEGMRALAFWDILEPGIAIARRNGRRAYFGFEYLVSKARSFFDSGEIARLTRNFPTLTLRDEWLSVDRPSHDVRND
jgi:hypothetical protein